MHLPRDAHDLAAPFSTTDSFLPSSTPLSDIHPIPPSTPTTIPTHPADLPDHNTDTAFEDTLVSALHAAFTPFVPRSPAASSTHSLEQDMLFGPFKDREKASLDIALTSGQITFRGTGHDVEPALLSGNLILSLTESTSFKSITLVFKGKARVPVNPNEPHVLNNSTSVFSLCEHEWTFLEGEKRHTHTLKPGRHIFPFELRIGGSLPSSIATYANGGASISYKLRAIAVRPGLAKSNLTASVPVLLSRTFATEALEYQQSLEIENSWPDKLMYSLVLPHKAWAAGDTLTALVKFAPLVKGVSVVSIATTIAETTKTYTRTSSHLESTRNVVQRRHEIVDGKAECVEDLRMRQIQRIIRDAVTSSAAHTQSVVGGSLAPFMVPQPAHPVLTSACIYNGRMPPDANAQSSQSSDEANARSASTAPTHPEHSARTAASSPSETSASSSTSPASADPENESQNSDVVTTVSILLPPTLTPSHALDPVIVSYRIRWSVLITNADGHTSELRCSLPLHILDHTHLASARAASRTTRRLLLGPSFAPNGGPDDRDDYGIADDEEEEEAELPSYPQHVRDRVANSFLPDAATVRVTNPWVANRVDPIGAVRRRMASASTTSIGSSTATGSSFRTLSASAPSTRPSSSGSGATSVGTSSGSSSGLGLHLGLGSRFGLHLGSRTPDTRTPSFSLTSADSGIVIPSTAGVDWMTSELVLSMTDVPSSLVADGGLSAPTSRPPFERLSSGQSSRANHGESRGNSRPTSRSGSRWTSRFPSRAASPDRGTALSSTSGADPGPVESESNGNAGASNANATESHAQEAARSTHVGDPSVSGREETHVHTHNPSSRQQHGIFSITLKPISSITPPWSSAHAHAHAHITSVAQASRSQSHANSHRTRSAGNSADMVLLGTAPSPPRSQSQSQSNSPPRSQPQSISQSPNRASVQLPTTSDPLIGAVLLRRAFTEVPDYSISSRGFLGGGAPPLDAMRDLPSYESSEASRRAMPVLAAVQEAS